MKRLLKIFAWIAGVLLTLAACLLTFIDRTPYKEMGYYGVMKARMDSLAAAYRDVPGDTLQAGWATASLVYPESIPLAG